MIRAWYQVQVSTHPVIRIRARTTSMPAKADLEVKFALSSTRLLLHLLGRDVKIAGSALIRMMSLWRSNIGHQGCRWLSVRGLARLRPRVKARQGGREVDISRVCDFYAQHDWKEMSEVGECIGGIWKLA